ncbi:Transcriptional regulatory protein, C terminal [Serratia fonticola]|uniref:winged helix-turn-helix domain-containing protein n=1 Tax=Serratia fonticola TaxID=47917 RepID=UPI0021834921|nr:winged helix-turn-helix domain-containing protein [Serratia fonticola]CAI2146733.1 Transcriptional regulatory protein, C terminal [Serratia fonticola]
MSSKVILNHYVIYDKKSGSLVDIGNRYDEIFLTTPANNCLQILLKNKPEITTQKELFEEVWEKYGIPINPNTLYQNIAMIRKAFRQLGLEEDIIVTIPRRGMLVADTVDITEYKECVDHREDNEVQVANLMLPNHPLDEGRRDVSNHNLSHYNIKKISLVFTSAMLLFFVIAAMTDFIYGRYLKTQSRLYYYSYWEDYNQCRLYVDEYFKSKMKNNGGKIPIDADLHCDNKEWVYISLYTGLPRESFIFCDGDALDKGSSCRSRYRYFIES